MQPEKIASHPFIDKTRASGFAYYMFPKCLLSPLFKKIGVGPDEALLYTVLRDRVKLSSQNKLVDSDGYIYVFFTRDNAASYFGWSKRKTITVFHNLVEAGLLRESQTKKANGRDGAKQLFIKILSPQILSTRNSEKLEDTLPEMTESSLLECDFGEYYVLPKIFFESDLYTGLSLNSILLYMFILDRLSLSERYERIDEKGLVWTTLDRDRVADELSITVRTLSKNYKELEDCGLIVRFQTGVSERHRIYARDFLPAPLCENASPDSTPEPPNALDRKILHPREEIFAPPTGKSCTPNEKYLHPVEEVSAPLEEKFLHPINLPRNKPYETELFEKQASSARAGEQKITSGCLPSEENNFTFSMRARAFELCHYDNVEDLLGQFGTDYDGGMEILDCCHDVISSDLSSSHEYAVVGKDSVSRSELIARYEKLNSCMIFLLIEKVLELRSEIRDMNTYLRSSLYQAPITRSTYAYHFAQEHDLPVDY